MNEARPVSGPVPIPVLQDIVEIRIGRNGQQVIVPLDLAQLAERIAADLVPHLRKRLQQHLETCLDQTLDAAMGSINAEVQRVLLEQLGNPDA
ncbi:MAG TPA: hypothetical protein VN448_04055 [Gammaproteobacteria bacterium]|jgi:hypothetical protein|nr:hypothetical protein [Gammaproteobacteria bacterium]